MLREIDRMKICCFRQVMHMTFCGKRNESSKCPKKCPARMKNLRPDNWGQIRLEEMLEARK